MKLQFPLYPKETEALLGHLQALDDTKENFWNDYLVTQQMAFVNGNHTNLPGSPSFI